MNSGRRVRTILLFQRKTGIWKGPKERTKERSFRNRIGPKNYLDFVASHDIVSYLCKKEVDTIAKDLLTVPALAIGSTSAHVTRSNDQARVYCPAHTRTGNIDVVDSGNRNWLGAMRAWQVKGSMQSLRPDSCAGRRLQARHGTSQVRAVGPPNATRRHS